MFYASCCVFYETMSSYNLTAKSRAEASSVSHLRSQGLLPAVLYGRGVKNTSLIVTGSDFEKVYAQAGGNSLIDLKQEQGDVVAVLVHAVQRHPVTDAILHIDFYQVRMDEKIHANINLVFANEAPAVKKFGGILVKPVDTVEVVCLPKDLIHELSVDLSVIESFDKVVYAEDISLPDGLTLAGEPKQLIAQVTPPKVAEEDSATKEEEEAEEKAEDTKEEQKDDKESEEQSKDEKK